MTAVHLIAALLSVLGFAALALAMERHQQDLFKSILVPMRTRLLRMGGWILLLLALVLLVRASGWSLGLVAYSGHTSLGAGVVFLTLVGIERWRLRHAPARNTR